MNRNIIIVESAKEIKKLVAEGKIKIGDWIEIKNHITFKDGSKGNLTVQYNGINFNTGFPIQHLKGFITEN